MAHTEREGSSEFKEVAHFCSAESKGYRGPTDSNKTGFIS